MSYQRLQCQPKAEILRFAISLLATFAIPLSKLPYALSFLFFFLVVQVSAVCNLVVYSIKTCDCLSIQNWVSIASHAGFKNAQIIVVVLVLEIYTCTLWPWRCTQLNSVELHSSTGVQLSLVSNWAFSGYYPVRVCAAGLLPCARMRSRVKVTG